ncbi:MAG: hypothetical protein RL757_592 [Bacteroidota bacterium]
MKLFSSKNIRICCPLEMGKSYWILLWLFSPLFVAGQTTPPSPALPRPDSVLLSVFNTGGKYRLTPAEFGAATPSFANGQNSLVSTVVFARDTSLRNNLQGCDSIAVNLRGKVALVERGGCSYVRKCWNAQRAGAIAVVLIDTIANGIAPVMTRTGVDSVLADSIRIPCYSVSKQKGDRIRALLPSKVGIRIPQYMPSDAERRGNTAKDPVAVTPEPPQNGEKAPPPVSDQEKAAQAQQLAEQQRLYPNPTSGVLFLDYQYAEIGDLKVQIRNIAGQLLFEQSVQGATTGKLELDVSDLVAGAYFVQLQHGNNRIAKALIIQH